MNLDIYNSINGKRQRVITLHLMLYYTQSLNCLEDNKKLGEIDCKEYNQLKNWESCLL